MLALQAPGLPPEASLALQRRPVLHDPALCARSEEAIQRFKASSLSLDRIHAPLPPKMLGLLLDRHGVSKCSTRKLAFEITITNRTYPLDCLPHLMVRSRLI